MNTTRKNEHLVSQAVKKIAAKEIAIDFGKAACQVVKAANVTLGLMFIGGGAVCAYRGVNSGGVGSAFLIASAASLCVVGLTAVLFPDMGTGDGDPLKEKPRAPSPTKPRGQERPEAK